MTGWFHVYCDGSAQMGPQAAPGGGHAGGWAAVVEHGSDGYVARGRQAKTTNTRMELVAVIEGLRSIRDGQDVVVHTDCSAVFRVRERQLRGILANSLGKDGDLWLELAAQFNRMSRVELRAVPKGGNSIHARAHAIAGSEAKAENAGLPANMNVLSRVEKKERRRNAERAIAGRPFAVEEAFYDALTRKRR